MIETKSTHYIDAHVHVWTNDVQKYGLAPGFTTAEMKPAAYLPNEILRDARPSGVDRIVLVQMSYYGFDNSYMLDAIEQYPGVFRGIAVIDGNSRAPDEEMRRLANLGVRGFRLYPDEVSPSNLSQEGFVAMFRCGAKERLAMCLLVNPDALATVGELCHKFPDTPIVIDHLARIGMTGSIRDQDVRNLCALAKYPQVYVKLSGFYALGQATPPHVDLIPLIEHVYEAYGPKRLMWGSDCPFLVAHEAYADGISLIHDRIDFIPSGDKDWVLSRTAEGLFFS
ncbi:MAG TPA: amidohydrolase family protein [Acidobacteriaceae bacterium]|nr:amidohydrolase family protein [Acidobacteriaceae bacterium]